MWRLCYLAWMKKRRTEPDISLRVGENIRLARIIQRMSQKDLGDACGMSGITISRIEGRGATDRRPRMLLLEEADAIAKALGISLPNLLAGSVFRSMP